MTEYNLGGSQVFFQKITLPEEIDGDLFKSNNQQLAAVLIVCPINKFDVMNLRSLENSYDKTKLSICRDFLLRVINTIPESSLLFILDHEFFLSLYDSDISSKSAFTFRYMVSIVFDSIKRNRCIPASHIGLSIYSKKNFPVNKVRIPHDYCQFCGENIKDWGGKKHLLNPEGTLMSDVWKHLNLSPQDIGKQQFIKVISNEIEKMISGKGELKVIQISPKNLEDFRHVREHQGKIDKSSLPDLNINLGIENQIINSDSLEILSKLPDSSIDLFFADPPYNLSKKYSNYQDNKPEEKYKQWTEKWLKEACRILKPTGSMFVLNIPKWAIKHVQFLASEKMWMRAWIVWNESAGPRGKLLPAHYSLLWFVKTPNYKFSKTANSLLMASDKYCKRASCKRRRNAYGVKDTVPLTDVWSDVHRIKHFNRKMKGHPCQLPELLLERIISIATEEGDIVLDPFIGTGTTTSVAKKRNRKFIGVDLDPYYVDIAQKRLEIKDERKIFTLFDQEEKEDANSVFYLTSKNRGLTKKLIQIELQKLAIKIGRVPTPEDLKREDIEITLEDVFSLFNNWKDAVYGAKIYLRTLKNNN